MSKYFDDSEMACHCCGHCRKGGIGNDAITRYCARRGAAYSQLFLPLL